MTADIRVPAGLGLEHLEKRIAELIDPLPAVSYKILRRAEANWTDPDHEIVTLLAANSGQVLGQEAFANMRVGASDSRLYRLYDVPTVVCGLTPNNMGAPDEHVSVKELYALAEIQGLTAFDFLTHISA